MNNPVNWFEIATENIERAKEFYAAVFKKEFEYLEMPGSEEISDTKMYMFHGNPETGGALGALVQADDNKPSANGTIIYFDCEDVANETSRVDAAGGKLLFPKMSIGEFGFIAQCIDTEGNRIGFHSRK